MAQKYRQSRASLVSCRKARAAEKAQTLRFPLVSNDHQPHLFPAQVTQTEARRDNHLLYAMGSKGIWFCFEQVRCQIHSV